MKTGCLKSQSGTSIVELLISSTILGICSLFLMALIGTSIASNTRNKFDSTTAMILQSIVEQISATVVGSGSSTLRDCNGTSWVIDTQPGGAALSGEGISFSEASPPTNYRM